MKTITFAVLALLVVCGFPAGAAVLSLQGPSSPVAAGSIITLNVAISGVVDLAGYEFEIGYDPSRVSGLSVSEGPFLLTAGSTLFIPGTIDDASGVISLTAGALVGMGAGATGDGILATLQFAAFSSGTASFSILSPLLYDSGFTPIDATVSGTRVTIAETATPEPSTLFLALSSLGLFLVLRRGTAKRA